MASSGVDLSQHYVYGGLFRVLNSNVKKFDGDMSDSVTRLSYY